MTEKLKLSIQGMDYEIDFPNVGQELDIQLLRHQLTDGKYGVMSVSPDTMDQYQVLIVDMISTFSTLIPQLKETLTAKSYLKLSQKQAHELLSVYTDTYVPWHTGWMRIITAPKTADAEETK